MRDISLKICRMRTATSVAGILVMVAGLLLVAGRADARTYKTDYITSPVGWCMIADAGGIGCSAEVLPGVTDGYFRLARRGRPVLGDTGGPITTKPLKDTSKKLRRGDRWKKRGIKCKAIRAGIKCSNGRHGFKLTKRSYKSW